MVPGKPRYSRQTSALQTSRPFRPSRTVTFRRRLYQRSGHGASECDVRGVEAVVERPRTSVSSCAMRASNPRDRTVASRRLGVHVSRRASGATGVPSCVKTSRSS